MKKKSKERVGLRLMNEITEVFGRIHALLQYRDGEEGEKI